MSIRALTVAAPTWFVLPSQKKADNPARFLIKGLLGRDQAIVGPEISVSRTGELQLSTRAISGILRAGLVNWENVLDAAGQPIDFEKLTPVEVQDSLRYNEQVAIATEILNLSYADPDDKKK